MTDDICGEAGAPLAHTEPMETPPADANGIGARIALAREARGMSMQGLGHILGGMSRQAVASWEKHGVIPDPKIWASIARALGVRYRWLTEGVGPMEGAEEGVAAAESELAPDIGRLMESIRSAALAGEHGLAAQGAEALARRLRETEVREQPGARDKPGTGKRAN